VVAGEVSARVKMKARVVTAGAAARIPPYFGSTDRAKYVIPTRTLPPTRNFATSGKRSIVQNEVRCAS
jgi:hypothetical protein